MKDYLKPIESDLPLAKVFNRIIMKLSLLRSMSIPRTFSDATGELAVFKMQSFYETVLWEKWLHGVFGRLEEWANIINEYFDEYSGSWEYYALSKRLDYINEYGSDDEKDYNPDGTVKTHGITREQLKYHTVFSDLYSDFVDIVQDTKPADLYSLISALKANSQISIIDILEEASGKKVESYILDESKSLRPATFVDKVEIKISEMAEADDLGKLIIQIAEKMESLTKKIGTVYRSDRQYQDNHDILSSILSEILSVLHLQLNGIVSC
ncbi:MAG: hypothetical protein IKT08_06445 [Bacteroidales bacterium]|nr:hypothetical protein [Bacteroidales bacterium]